MAATRRALAICLAATIPALGLLAACGKSGEQSKAAYDACLKAAQQDARIGKATFAKLEDATIAGSTGEEELRANIPYTLDGQKGLFQCIAQKQSDGSFKVVF